MKLQMVSINVGNRIHTFFAYFPAGTKPYITKTMMEIVGVSPGMCFGVGGNPWHVYKESFKSY